MLSSAARSTRLFQPASRKTSPVAWAMPMGPETGALAPPLIQEMISLRASFSESKVERQPRLQRRPRAAASASP